MVCEHGLDHSLDDGREEVLLVVEVVVVGTLTEPGLRENAVQRGDLQSVAAEVLGGDVEKLFAVVRRQVGEALSGHLDR